MSLTSVAMWRNRVFKKISCELGLDDRELEEIHLLKVRADAMRTIRKRLLCERFD